MMPASEEKKRERLLADNTEREEGSQKTDRDQVSVNVEWVSEE